MAKKKAAGKLKIQTNTVGKRLGLKVGNGERVTTGSILVRQRGTKYLPGEGVNVGRDHSIFAMKKGVVKFGQKQGRTHISVV